MYAAARRSQLAVMALAAIYQRSPRAKEVWVFAGFLQFADGVL